MKLILSILLLTVLLSVLALAYNEETRLTPGRLTPIQKTFAPTNYGLILQDEIARVRSDIKYSATEISAEMIDSVKDEELKGTMFYNTIHIADVEGRPKYSFSSSENVYLKDRRIIQAREFWDQRTENQRWSNLYPPNTEVDVYLLLDLQFYGGELDQYRFTISSSQESRTRNTQIVKKYTITTDAYGRLPFLNLGKVSDLTDNHNLFSTGKSSREGVETNTNVQPGMHGTLDYSDTIGNRLSGTNFRPNSAGFDVFVDSNRNGRYTPYLSSEYIATRHNDADYYLYYNSPAFEVKLDTLKSIQTCCTCEESERVFFTMADIYSCSEYCGTLDEDVVEFGAGACETMISSQNEALVDNDVEEVAVDETQGSNNDNSEMIKEATGEAVAVVAANENEIEPLVETKEKSSFIDSLKTLDKEKKNLLLAVVVFIVLLLLLIFVASSSKKTKPKKIVEKEEEYN